MNTASKRVLVTGVNGFTGRYMRAELETNGYEVFGLGTHPNDDPNYRQVKLTDAQALHTVLAEIKPSAVVHLAALAFVAHGDANAFYETNLVGTRNLLEAISASGCVPECVLLASSANVYGNASEGVLDEQVTPAPANDYAVSKLAMEYMAKLWMDRLPIVITRPFNYTGQGQASNFLLPKITSHFIRKAERIELGNLDVWRDFSDVRAVVQAYRRLLEVKAAGLTVNVCSGNLYSLREVLTLCEAITRHSLAVEINPAFVRANEVKRLCGDPTRLRSVIGEWDTPSLEETLRWMLAERE